MCRFIILTAVICSVGCTAVAEPPARSPNFVIVFLDDSQVCEVHKTTTWGETAGVGVFVSELLDG